ncbi:hypothetical protein AKJ09_04789 [Labilithrix luteola]|uniref:Uncharacterized protein n=1 Tax=Labilithrix luteola TaxID=1391654 RepID=A0A0K1PX65_9BACT|nr:hypothetical protein [Labilithrix luteola]AKU98125.1 hypothetical protein AKJ09_04789 [Labilithrix luteola]
MSKKKNDTLGFTLLPAGVAALFLGIGSFNRESSVMAITLIGIGAAMLGIAWRVLKEPPHESTAPAKAPKAPAPQAESVRAEAAE